MEFFCSNTKIITKIFVPRNYFVIISARMVLFSICRDPLGTANASIQGHHLRLLDEAREPAHQQRP